MGPIFFSQRNLETGCAYLHHVQHTKFEVKMINIGYPTTKLLDPCGSGLIRTQMQKLLWFEKVK